MPKIQAKLKTTTDTLSTKKEKRQRKKTQHIQRGRVKEGTKYFGYDIVDHQLIPMEEPDEIALLFQEVLDNVPSITTLV